MSLQSDADRTFLGLTIWREASNQPRAAKVAIGYCIKNRVSHPKWWGSDVMSVVFKKWQFSSLTAPGDPNLDRWPSRIDPSWIESLAVAESVLAADLLAANPVKGADSYYDSSIAPPAWTMGARFVGEIGALKFYDVGRDFERDAAKQAEEGHAS